MNFDVKKLSTSALVLSCVQAFANPSYLECTISSFSVPVSLTINEAIGKLAFTFSNQSDGGYSTDAQFTPSMIQWTRQSSNPKQTERYQLDRVSLKIERQLHLYGSTSPSTRGEGSCQLVTPAQRKI